jgi:ABC-type uncharacterized transport system substrate-binding protein
MKLLFQYCLALTVIIHSTSILADKCLYVSSYHKGYEWDDGILASLEKTLDGRCELRKIYLDTKRNPQEEWARWRSKEAKKVIDEYKPDIVIAVDDNASRYLVMPYLKNVDIPVVFCGVNWSMSEYGYPYKNTTGMIEVSPIQQLVKQLKLFQPDVKKGIFISGDVLSEHKDYNHYKKIFAKNQIQISPAFVKNFREWVDVYKKSQGYDFIFLGNNAGINDWYKPEAQRIVDRYTKKISVTTYKWMLPYTAMAYTKLPEEQGVWAARVALSILDGVDPAQIPVIHNRLWDMWLNPHIINKIKLKIPYLIYKRAKHYQFNEKT